jgi:hypothetical protein
LRRTSTQSYRRIEVNPFDLRRVNENSIQYNIYSGVRIPTRFCLSSINIKFVVVKVKGSKPN